MRLIANLPVNPSKWEGLYNTVIPRTFQRGTGLTSQKLIPVSTKTPSESIITPTISPAAASAVRSVSQVRSRKKRKMRMQRGGGAKKRRRTASKKPVMKKRRASKRKAGKGRKTRKTRRVVKKRGVRDIFSGII